MVEGEHSGRFDVSSRGGGVQGLVEVPLFFEHFSEFGASETLAEQVSFVPDFVRFHKICVVFKSWTVVTFYSVYVLKNSLIPHCLISIDIRLRKRLLI